MTARPAAWSTYRLQLRAGVTLDDAARLVGYVADLGVTHLYLSPPLQAAGASTHGYDVVDPRRIDESLGGREAFDRLHRAARERGIGLVVDIVPNHLALVSPANPWWVDVLRHGPDSDWADVFDIDWRPGPHGQPQVLLPQLGAPLLEELLGGRSLQLRPRDGEPWITYHEHAWPVRPGTLEPAGLPTDPEAAFEVVAADPARLLPLLARQHYELAHWRRASTDLNYRRFFDITTLGGVRVEDPAVFDATHELVLELVADGVVDGLRIDHPDGLRDPAGYVARLRAAAPDTWIVVEKILEPGEPLRPWPIDGTVGYEFATTVGGLFVDPAGLPVLDAVHTARTGRSDSWREAVEEAKRQVIGELFGAELAALTARTREVAHATGVACGEAECRAALVELLVAFPVYRTYVAAEEGRIAEEDRRVISEAIAVARARRPDLDEVLVMLLEVLTLTTAAPGAAELIMRVQQLTGPVMAKGAEDTASYRWVRLAGANEVGGDPADPATSVAEFHAANLSRQREWPRTMLLTSSHDTKRSEDVRARLAVLTEQAAEWADIAAEWEEATSAHVTRPHHDGVAGEQRPARGLSYLALQTAVGAWPISQSRLTEYLRKAARERKAATHWLDVDEAYEADLEGFVERAFADPTVVAMIERVVEGIREPGWLTALSQTLLKLTSPGVPDTYQGTELWDLSLVDPDNRRPVAFDTREDLLAQIRRHPEPEEVLAEMDSGMPKLLVTARALQARRDHPDAFGPDGSYEPLWAAGPKADHVVAFLRGGTVATIAPRLVMGLGGPFHAWDFQGTTVPLPPGRWRDLLTDTAHDVGEDGLRVDLALSRFPVALLVGDGA